MIKKLIQVVAMTTCIIGLLTGCDSVDNYSLNIPASGNGSNGGFEQIYELKIKTDTTPGYDTEILTGTGIYKNDGWAYVLVQRSLKDFAITPLYDIFGNPRSAIEDFSDFNLVPLDIPIGYMPLSNTIMPALTLYEETSTGIIYFGCLDKKEALSVLYGKNRMPMQKENLPESINFLMEEIVSNAPGYNATIFIAKEVSTDCLYEFLCSKDSLGITPLHNIYYDVYKSNDKRDPLTMNAFSSIPGRDYIKFYTSNDKLRYLMSLDKRYFNRSWTYEDLAGTLIYPPKNVLNTAKTVREDLGINDKGSFTIPKQ